MIGLAQPRLMLSVSSTLSLKWCGYWMCSQPLKISLLCLYTDVLLKGEQTHFQKICVISIPWRQSIELIKQMCQKVSLRGISCVPVWFPCVYRQSCRSVVQCKRLSAYSRWTETQSCSCVCIVSARVPFLPAETQHGYLRWHEGPLAPVSLTLHRPPFEFFSIFE